MFRGQQDDNIAIDVKSQKLLTRLLGENPKLAKIMREAVSAAEARSGIKAWVMEDIQARPYVLKYYNCTDGNKKFKLFLALKWRDYAAVRLLDYVEHGGREFPDLNLGGEYVQSDPVKLLWLAVKQGVGHANAYFFTDLLHLFRQFTGKRMRKMPSRQNLETWMERYPSGLDPRIIKLRQENRDRIITIIIELIDNGEIKSEKFNFEAGMTHQEKFDRAQGWWADPSFHYVFAVRSPEVLNRMLAYSLDPATIDILYDAKKAGIPFFINPYYLSLLYVHTPEFGVGADLVIRDYIIYSRELVEEFGKIKAWEKEDVVQPGEPNAAGWILPMKHNIHRRYPHVAVLIPDSMGRACGGLCTTCQRMYNFQSGLLNFNLDKLKPNDTWSEKLAQLMDYFENDSQLRDILITGGDALMSSDKTLRNILDAVYNMAKAKREANKKRKDGEKYAEMLRVRLGSRLPIYLPQRISPELVNLLADFKEKASQVGITQFVIQTHFESPMEVTPEARDAVRKLLESGWMVTNQLVFTAAASRRGHTARLRQVLNEIGVMSYYTFSVKGYRENKRMFAPNARAVQEMMEEKVFGLIPGELQETIKQFPFATAKMIENIGMLREQADLLFLSTDRNVLNIPGVGKSLTFRVIGITHDGRRILEFDHDQKRHHSPIIHKMGKVIVIESKSVAEYLEQLEDMGEDADEYRNLFGYSLCETEERMPIYKYPEYNFKVTEEFTNLQIPG